jgi:hypothetical protein
MMNSIDGLKHLILPVLSAVLMLLLSETALGFILSPVRASVLPVVRR